MDAKTLSDRMECDHVVLIGEGGTITDAAGVYAPEAIWNGWGDGVHIEPGSEWAPLSGYSGQDGYRGPVMHVSEFIGGRIADHILNTPGYWVWTVVEDIDDPESPAGWVVCFQDAGEVGRVTDLKLSATSGGIARGHSLGEWTRSVDGKLTACCANCNRTITVDPHPAPNGVEISGAACAIDCIIRNMTVNRYAFYKIDDVTQTLRGHVETLGGYEIAKHIAIQAGLIKDFETTRTELCKRTATGDWVDSPDRIDEES